MFSTPTPAELATPTPGFVGWIGAILAGLGREVARQFLTHPRFAPLLIPLCNRLSRAAARLARLAALHAMGRLPAPRAARPARPGAAAPSRIRLPRQPNWLRQELGFPAAGFASQLRHLIGEPEMAAFLAACPTACGILRPLCRMLGIPPTALPAPPARASRASDTPPAATPPAATTPAWPALPPPRPTRPEPPPASDPPDWFNHLVAKPA